MQFGKKKKLTDYINKKVWIAILFIIVLLQAFSVYDRYRIAKEMSERHQEVAARLEALETRKGELQSEVDYRSAERGVEEEIRSNFDVAEDGEQVIILTGETKDSAAVVPETAEIKFKWWQFWR